MWSHSDFGSAWVGGPPPPTGRGRVEGKRPRVLVLTGLRKAGPRPARPKLQLVSPPPEKQLPLPDQPSHTAQGEATLGHFLAFLACDMENVSCSHTHVPEAQKCTMCALG